MRTITLVAYNRLGYLKQLVASLQTNILDGYTLFIGVEPTDQTVVDFCQKLDFMPTVVTLNRQRLGVSANPLATISRAFDSGSEFNIALEDDLVISPDALDLAEWFRCLQNNNYFCLNLFNYGSDPNQAELVMELDHFAPLGWACTARVWFDWILPNWTVDARGWDFSVNSVLATYGPKKVLAPQLARANHIGRDGGAHCTPELHDRFFSCLRISDGQNRHYRLKPEVP